VKAPGLHIARGNDFRVLSFTIRSTPVLPSVQDSYHTTLSAGRAGGRPRLGETDLRQQAASPTSESRKDRMSVLTRPAQAPANSRFPSDYHRAHTEGEGRPGGAGRESGAGAGQVQAVYIKALVKRGGFSRSKVGTSVTKQ
jgi:hypothetical protein